MKERLSLVINGRPTELEVDPNRTLVRLLREDLGLTGTKEGCGRGYCGACSVIVNGKIRPSCILPVTDLEGKQVTSIEGIGTWEKPHPIQLALVEAGAVQCGFCTPGMVVSAKALLDVNPDPSRQEVIRWLSRNLCRCTGYAKIVEGVLNAASILRGDPRPERETPAGSLGTSVIRPDSLKKALGLARYGADLRKAEMLHAKVLRSPHHHARVVRLDASEARRLPGVEAVLTSSDIPGCNLLSRPRDRIKDQPFLVQDRVRRLGDPIALVAATSEEIAQRALAKIKVEYQPLAAVFDPVSALEEGAPKLHPAGNLLSYQRIARGDIAEGFSQADVVVENRYVTPFLEHAYLEPEVAVAYPSEGGRITIETPFGQSPYIARDSIAAVLGIEPEQVRLRAISTGGSFGGKSDIFLQTVPALLSHELGKPVRLKYDREESFQTTTKRHPAIMRYSTGASREGKLTALKADILLDTGAYAAAGAAVCQRAALHATGPYEIANVLVEARVAYTNNPVCSTMRGPGVPQVTFAVESQMDILAERLGIDPLDLRLMNALGPDSPTAHGQILGPGFGIKNTLEAIRPWYKAAKDRLATHRAGRVRRGVGLACMWYGLGTKMPAPAQVYLELLPDGRIGLFTGAAEMGQGITSALAQLAAEELKVPFPVVTVTNADTDLTPPGAFPTGSRQTMYSGNAVRQAASGLRELLLNLASELLEDKTQNISCEQGQFFSQAYPDQRVSLARLAALCQAKGISSRFHGSYDTDVVTGLDADTGQGTPYISCATATQLAELEVNINTGAVKVLKMAAAQDVGKAINPRDVQGQIEGAIMMGLGFALTEEFVPGKSKNFSQYRIPRMKDLPELIPLIVEVPEPAGPFGVKGLGECASLGTAPAIINALASAIGKRILHLPATRKRVLEAIRTQTSPSP